MKLLADHSLRQHNTLALEASARYFLLAHSEAEIQEGLAFADAEGLELLPLGQGSNLVLAGDVPGLVLQLGTRGIEVLAERGEALTLRVQAGESWHGLVEWAVSRGLYGLENLALIPGSVGAAPIQNIGAYGVELQDCLSAVHVLERGSRRSLRLDPIECQLAYRDSIFKGELRDQVVITSLDVTLSRRAQVRAEYPSLAAALALQGVQRPSPEDVFKAVIAVRRERLPDPAEQPNAGSFFKNPVVSRTQAELLQQSYPGMPLYPAAREDQCKLAAAWLIEQCGWKGWQDNGLAVHPGHALILLNRGNNSGRSLLILAERISDSVAARFDVRLEIEPRVCGQTVV